MSASLPVSAALSIYVFSMSIFITGCKMALVYDRQTLMDIRVAFETARTDTCAFRPSPPPTYPYFPSHQYQHVTDLPWKKKHRRKRGKRAGVAVWLRSSADLLSAGPGMIRGLRLHWRSLDSSYRWLRPVVPGPVSPRCLLPRVRRGGVNTSNL